MEVLYLGGKEAARGFLYQAYAAVLEALCSNSSWEKIHIEYPTEGDKVDVALEQNNEIIKCIQVKSTVDQFSKPALIKWFTELVKDKGCPEYELFLIGQCAPTANKFVKSLEKYQNNITDKETISSLQGFDLKLLCNRKFVVKVLPFDTELLEKILNSSLHQYLCSNKSQLSFEQLSLVTNLLVRDQMVQSSIVGERNRVDFDQIIHDAVKMFIQKATVLRETIGVKSFARGTENLESETVACLSLLDYFDDRHLKAECSWNDTIYLELEKFVSQNFISSQNYQIKLECHISIAFSLGQLLSSKRGFNVVPIQKPRYGTNLPAVWDGEATAYDYQDPKFHHIAKDRHYSDSVLILGITQNITDDVMDYIEKTGLNVGRIIEYIRFTDDKYNFIQDGKHATQVVDTIYYELARRETIERKARLHIFSAAPTGLMFYLGQKSQGIGKCTLYEFDFEGTHTATYLKSIEL